MLGEGDDIHVTLDHNDPAGVADGVSGEIEPVELFSLREDGSFGRVEVFWLAIPEHTAAESDHAPAGIVDRKHDPIAKPVVALASVAGDDETCRIERCV